MTKRMSDDVFLDELAERSRSNAFNALSYATREALRARDEEERSEKLLQEKDATIKTLADALTFAERRHAPGCPPAICTCGADAALRLAGRLP